MRSIPLNANFSEELGDVVTTSGVHSTTIVVDTAVVHDVDFDDDDTELPPLIDLAAAAAAADDDDDDDDDDLPQLYVNVDERRDYRNRREMSMVPDELRDDDRKKRNCSRYYRQYHNNFDGFGQVVQTTIPHTAISLLPSLTTGHTQEVLERMFM
jgi:hypothetical protein